MADKRGPDTHHVVPNPNGGWDVKRGGGERASGHFDTKQDATNYRSAGQPQSGNRAAHP